MRPNGLLLGNCVGEAAQNFGCLWHVKKNIPLYKGRPLSSLVVKKSNNAGRNNQGRITVRHKGGGHKRLYRLIDFKRLKDSVSAKVERIEYDPNRTSNIALLCYADGERRYIIAPKDLDVGMHVVSGDSVDIKVGNCISLANTQNLS